MRTLPQKPSGGHRCFVGNKVSLLRQTGGLLQGEGEHKRREQHPTFILPLHFPDNPDSGFPLLLSYIHGANLPNFWRSWARLDIVEHDVADTCLTA